MENQNTMKTKMFVNDVEASGMFDYVVSFYGSNGVYSNFFEADPINELTIDLAIAYHRYIICPTMWDHNGDGDTFDRELVRDIMFIMKGMRKPSEVEWSGIMTKFFTPTGRYKRKYQYWMEKCPKEVSRAYTMEYFISASLW